MKGSHTHTHAPGRKHNTHPLIENRLYTHTHAHTHLGTEMESVYATHTHTHLRTPLMGNNTDTWLALI